MLNSIQRATSIYTRSPIHLSRANFNLLDLGIFSDQSAELCIQKYAFEHVLHEKSLCLEINAQQHEQINIG